MRRLFQPTMGLIVVRPEPGNARTVARLRAGGGDALAWLLFAAQPVAWGVPDPAAHDALLVTSATRCGCGTGLARLMALPVIAVGAETAAVARRPARRRAGTGGVVEALAADARWG